MLSKALHIAHGATSDDFSGQFFRIFEINCFCFVVAICDLVHNVELKFPLSYVLTASANCSFTGITHISEKISRCC